MARMVTCETCGADVPEPGMYCSAGADLVCGGHAPVAGCGRVLTQAERHWYGDCCEKCTEEWGDRIEAWRTGGEDHEFEKFYGGQQDRRLQ